MLNSVIWTPLIFGLIGLVVPRRLVAGTAIIGTLVTLGLTIAVLAGFDSAGGMQYVTDVSWIPGLGIDYSLGVDGISIFLILLAAAAWVPAAIFSGNHQVKQSPRLYFLMLLISESATLGAFLAQDLILFVLFFDFMLIPFYFLFGAWGRNRDGVTAARAVIKMVVFTLIGSLLMLVGAIATGIIAADGGSLTFSIQELAARGLPEGSQNWIFWFFAAAFLVKMPAFPLHGWMPDAYRAAPLPALAVFSGVLAKVAAYGFLRIVLPIMPDAAQLFQTTLIILAVSAIIYGASMAFTTRDLRLILGFSSVSQLGFITAGIFALNDSGSQGAVLQMVNHGIVVVPAFLIVAVVAQRTGTEDIGSMGGLARRAPVLAAIFLIVAMATLALPVSSNFIGELYILNGIYGVSSALAVIASSGVVLAAFYGLRMYQQTMHNPLPEEHESRELSFRDGLAIVPLVLCIVALAFAPQLVMSQSGDAVKSNLAAVEGTSAPGGTDLATTGGNP